jgi:hypothetical protein
MFTLITRQSDSSFCCYTAVRGGGLPDKTTTAERKLRAERQRRHSIIAGGQKVVLYWFGWNLPRYATH